MTFSTLAQVYNTYKKSKYLILGLFIALFSVIGLTAKAFDFPGVEIQPTIGPAPDYFAVVCPIDGSFNSPKLYSGVYPDDSTQVVIGYESTNCGSALGTGLPLGTLASSIASGPYWFAIEGSTDSYFSFAIASSTLVFGSSNIQTRVELYLPANNATTTSGGSTGLVFRYYINSSQTPETSDNPVYLNLRVIPLSRGGIFSNAVAPYEFNGQTQIADFLWTNDEHTLNMPDGAYQWQVKLLQKQTAPCVANAIFCAYRSLFGGTIVSTTTVAQSESRVFIVGNAGYYSTTTDQGNSTSNPFKWCKEYNGGNIIVTALCFIPTAIDNAVTLMFVPDPFDVALEQASFQQAFGNLLKSAPWGYLTRTVAIISSDATTTLPAFIFELPSGPLASSTVSIDPQDMVDGAGALMATFKDPKSGLTLEEIVKPWLQLFIAFTVLFIIIGDLTGSHKHKPQ